jgi:hypothetical protein
MRVDMAVQTGFLRKYATPLTMGAFLLLSVTGILMFFHWDTGLNKLAHEWLGWALVIGVAAHLFVNLPSFKKHLASAVGRGAIAVFAILLGLSFINPGNNRAQFSMRSAMEHLAHAPLVTLAAVAKISPEDLVARLKAQGIAVDDLQATPVSLSGGDEGAAKRVLGIAFSAD